MIKNKSKKLRLAAVAAAIAVASAVTVYAAYDSSKDPIVSLSYLSQVFKPEVKGELKTELKSELKNEIKSEVKSELESSVGSSVKEEVSAEISSSVASAKDSVKAELKSEFDELYSAPIEALQAQLDALANEYETVTVEKGKRITANAACEFVILSGSATVRCSATDAGIIDCTDGVILYDGQNIPENHKLLVPENGDGRGITAVGTVQLLVKGGYTVG